MAADALQANGYPPCSTPSGRTCLVPVEVQRLPARRLWTTSPRFVHGVPSRFSQHANGWRGFSIADILMSDVLWLVDHFDSRGNIGPAARQGATLFRLHRQSSERL
jgi:hypothetical protein